MKVSDAPCVLIPNCPLRFVGRLEEAVQTAAAGETGQQTRHQAAGFRLVLLRIVALGRTSLRRAVGAILRRIALLRITTLLRIATLLGRVAALLLVVAHLGRWLLVVALLTLLALLVGILVTAIGSLRGRGRLSIGRRFVLLVGHRDGFWADIKGMRYLVRAHATASDRLEELKLGNSDRNGSVR